jgi:putative oxidoreductase
MDKFMMNAHSTKERWMKSITQLLCRVMLALVFIFAGVSKLKDPSGTMAYMQAMGVPGFLLWPTIPFEILGGISLVLGYKTRIIAYTLATFCITTAVIFHHDFNDQMQTIMFLKNIAIAGGLLLLAISGRMAYSMDNRRTENNFFGTRFYRQ